MKTQNPKRISSVCLITILILSMIIPFITIPFASAYNTIAYADTPDPADATSVEFQRKVFYDIYYNYFYVFYSNGTHMIYHSSSDGESWNSGVVVTDEMYYGQYFSIWYDQDRNKVHYAYGGSLQWNVIRESLYFSDGFYRAGTPEFQLSPSLEE